MRIEQREQFRLHENIAGAEACRMIWVTLNFCRMSFVCFDQDAPRVAAERQRTRIVERFAGNNLLGFLDVGHDVLRWISRAAARSRERNRRAHELNKSSAT